MKTIMKSLITGLLFASGATSLTAQAAGVQAGDWIVRVRGIHVSPNDSSTEVEVPALGGNVPGSSVSVNSSTVPELDITYMLTPHIGAELILGTSQHDVAPHGAALIGALDGLPPLGTGSDNVIEAWALPPTLTLQYHFAPNSSVRPYAGVGVNYTLFYSEDVSGPLAVSGSSVNMRPSLGWAAQFGADFDLANGWFANIDVKYIDMNTTAEFRNTAVGDVNVDVDINPFVFGIGIGRRF